MSKLHFKRIDAQESEVWYEDTDPRVLSNDAIRLAVQQVCAPEVFELFWAGYPDVGNETTLDDPNVDGLAGQFELRGAEQDARPQ
jgi:hypothetical protein